MPVRTPQETLAAAANAGVAKASKPFPQTAVGSILAGAYIALGGSLSIIIGYGFPGITADNPGLQRLMSGLVFPIGLMLVVILGADLFTGNNALLVPGAIDRRISAKKLAANWATVWTGNFIGALAFAYLMVYLCNLCDTPPYSTALTKIALTKTSQPVWVVILKGIGANWCVCLAVWLAMSGRRLGEKLLACEIPVMAFVALGYEHCVANMFFLPLAMMQGAPISTGTMLTANLLPATIGNIIGGAIFVACAHNYLYRQRQ